MGNLYQYQAIQLPIKYQEVPAIILQASFNTKQIMYANEPAQRILNTNTFNQKQWKKDSEISHELEIWICTAKK